MIFHQRKVERGRTGTDYGAKEIELDLGEVIETIVEETPLAAEEGRPAGPITSQRGQVIPVCNRDTRSFSPENCRQAQQRSKLVATEVVYVGVGLTQ